MSHYYNFADYNRTTMKRPPWGIIDNPGMWANFERQRLRRSAKSRRLSARLSRNAEAAAGFRFRRPAGFKPKVRTDAFLGSNQDRGDVPSRASLIRGINRMGSTGQSRRRGRYRRLTAGGTPQLSRAQRIGQLAAMPEGRGNKELARIRRGGSTYETPREKAGRQLVARLKGMPQGRGRSILNALYRKTNKRKSAAKPSGTKIDTSPATPKTKSIYKGPYSKRLKELGVKPTLGPKPKPLVGGVTAATSASKSIQKAAAEAAKVKAAEAAKVKAAEAAKAKAAEAAKTKAASATAKVKAAAAGKK